MTKHSDLNSAAIAAHCATGAAHVAIEVVDETGSTNADLLARCATLAGPTLRIAGQQTAGRGRAGRPWVSQADASLMFSLAWRFKGPLHQLVGLPLAVGVALAETMTSSGPRAGSRLAAPARKSSPQTSSALLTAINPVIDSALRTFAGSSAQSPTVRSKAKLIVLDALRKQRNLNDYEGDPVSDSTVAECCKQAALLLAHTQDWLRKNRPDPLASKAQP